MSSLPNIVLVHGAWADGSCWSGVIEGLQAEGLKVTAPQFPLTSLADVRKAASWSGETSSTLNDVTLTADGVVLRWAFVINLRSRSISVSV